MNFFPGALLILAISWLTVHQVESIPSGNEGICSLPCEVGPCKAAFERWYYDNKTKSCKEFIYGGCEGNMNNFESFDACQHTCSEGSEQVQSASADSQTEDTAKVFNELTEKGSNPGALKDFFPEKRGQHLLPRLLSPKSRQKEVKKSQMEQTKETYRKLDRVGVHPEDLRPFFTSGQRVKRENLKGNFPVTPEDIESLVEEENNQPVEDPSESSSTVATTTAAAATSSSVSTALAPSTTTSGTQTTSESTTKSVSTSLAKTISSPAVEMTAEVTASPSSPTAKTPVENKNNTKTTASPALTSKTSTSSTVAKTTSIDGAGAGAGAGAGVVTTTSTTVAETQSTTKTTDRSSSTKTPSTTSQSTSTTAPDQGGDTKTSSTSSSSSASSSYETTTFTETSTSVSPTTTTVASSSTAVLDESNPDVPVGTDSDTPDGSDNGPDYHNSDIPRRKYQLHEHTSSHFAAFFLSSIVLVFAVYIAYHNRQRIIAVIIEGRSENRRRPGNYRKLETNVEEAMPSMRKYVA